MLHRYLPEEKVIAVNPDEIIEAVPDATAAEMNAVENTHETVPATAKGKQEAKAEETTAETDGFYIDTKLGMKYSGDMEEMYREFLAMFCQRREDTQAKLRTALNDGNLADYTTYIHALKSTALSMGGRELSEKAKALEMAGHAYQDGPQEEKAQQLQFIKDNHDHAMELYDAFVKEAKERKLWEPK